MSDTNDDPTWSEIVAAGWAPDYAAGNVLVCLRKGNYLTGARWYYARLTELMRGELLPAYAEPGRSSYRIAVGRAAAVKVRLDDLLTNEEKEMVKEPVR